MNKSSSIAVIVFLLFSVSSINILAQKTNAAYTISSTLKGSRPSRLPKTVKILAVMVEFQKDNDALTIGNGLMDSIYTGVYGQKILDPLPHDSAYFAAHLLFAKNYFSRVSNGNLQIEYTVLPIRLQLSQIMRKYSPWVRSTDFTATANMVKEVWTKADITYTGFDFSKYDLFAIYHAGVGRDVSLPGSLGNELDIPSVYLGTSSLKKYLGANFQGVPVSGNSFYITNSMILPQTENREQESYGNKYLLQLTTNGLLVSSIASHLGLPDLFDTKTGLSAIGRFGLMDGQSIFTYGGAFPPSPGAWERIDLGWTTPIVAGIKDSAIFHVRASLKAGPTDTAIIKIPITSSEYFLVENKQRDVNADGVKLTIYSNGAYKTIMYPNDTTGFNSYGVDSLYGVVVDVDEPDWAAPGNGAVIWHIDESIIAANRADNLINADKKHRGVVVMEADGSQDIGETFYTIFGDQVIGEGTDQDLWYKGNTAKLFRNIFDQTSRPSTKANSGSNSLITLKNFSAPDEYISFSLLTTSGTVKKDTVVKFSLPSKSNKVVVSKRDGLNYNLILSGTTLVVCNQNLEVKKTVPNFSSKNIVSYGDKVVGAIDSLFSFFDLPTLTLTQTAAKEQGEIVSADPLIDTSISGTPRVLFGTSKGRVYYFNYLYQGFPISIDSCALGFSITALSAYGNPYFALAKRIDETDVPRYYVFDSQQRLVNARGRAIDFNSIKMLSGDNIFVVLTSSNKFDVYNSNGKLTSSFTINADSPISSFSVSDLLLDGTPYILAQTNSHLYAYNLQGAIADHFPVTLSDKVMLSAFKPSTFLNPTNNTVDIYAMCDNGIHIVSAKDGSESASSPIAIDGLSNSQFSFFKGSNSDLRGVTIDSNGVYYSWSLFPPGGEILYNGTLADVMGSKGTVLTTKSNRILTFMPMERTYNYPNPVYGGFTNFRYYVAEDSKISIKVFDLAGDYVAQLSGSGKGGYDNEIKWDVTNIQSGVYLANLEAVGISGKKNNKIIKVAIIK